VERDAEQRGQEGGMERNEFVVGDDPTAIQARCFARLAEKRENMSLHEPAKPSADACQELSPTTAGMAMSSIKILELGGLRHGVLQ
jgi:hypothetical protein